MVVANNPTRFSQPGNGFQQLHLLEVTRLPRLRRSCIRTICVKQHDTHFLATRPCRMLQMLIAVTLRSSQMRLRHLICYLRVPSDRGFLLLMISNMREATVLGRVASTTVNQVRIGDLMEALLELEVQAKAVMQQLAAARAHILEHCVEAPADQCECHL
jgi:hypothetical protein